MLKAPGKTYACFCGKILQLKDTQLVRTHVNNCKEYHKNSPFAELFFGSDLTKLSYAELLTLQYEFELYTKIIEEELTQHNSIFKKTIPYNPSKLLNLSNTKQIQQ